LPEEDAKIIIGMIETINITEKDHEIKYLNNTIFTIGREYCSNAANFRPSAINLNREREWHFHLKILG